MPVRPCGDCATPLASNAKGCPVCGRNLVGERRFAIALAIAGLATIVAIVLVALFAR